MLRVWTLLVVAVAWSGSLHKKGHLAKLRAHGKEGYGLRTAHGAHVRAPKITKLRSKSARLSKHLFFGKTSPPAVSVATGDFFPLGPGRCVYKGGLAINSTDYQHIAGASDISTCKEACINNADCKALYANEYGCFMFLNDKRQLRAPTAGSVDKASPYCWAKSRTYSLSYPFHGVYSPELKFEQCAEISDLTPYLDLPVFFDVSMSVGSTTNTKSVDTCAVACAPYAQFGGKFFVGDDKCFCGDATSIGNAADASSCGTARDNFLPARYSGTPTTYAQYTVRYPQLGEDCPDGDRNIPSRYVKSGDLTLSGALDGALWTKMSIDMAFGDGCAYLCAGVCNEHGASCHGYTCVTPQTASPFLWFSGLNEDSWDGHDSHCYIALNRLPIVDRQQPLTPTSLWKHTAVVCARRDCLERTVCASKDFHRLSGYVFPDSVDLLSSPAISSCAQCSDKCLENDTCFSYQCSESLATAYNSSTANCLLFKSYRPESLQTFNVSDVAVCRRVASDKCITTDGVTPVGNSSCACGTTTCLGSNHNVTMACYIDPEHPIGICEELPQSCPEGQVRANVTATMCQCVSKVQCDAESSCVESDECPRPPPGCESNATDPCPDAPLATQCVQCSDISFNQTVSSKCAASCLAQRKESECNGTVTITSGPCSSPNNCTNPKTSDDIVCGSDGKEYLSQCDLNAVPNVTLANTGECSTNCTHLADTDCHCGPVGDFCDSGKAEYCSGTSNGTCVTVCNPQDPHDTACLCPSSGGMANATFCPDTAGNVSASYCPASNPSNTTSACEHDSGCVLSCDILSTQEQLSKSCLCDAAFCCHAEVCVAEGATAQCTKVCDTIGESECTCLSGDISRCEASEGAWATHAFADGACTCVPFCTVEGQTDCLCQSTTSEYCTGGQICSILPAGEGKCVPVCTAYGQTNCLCGNETTQYCDSTTTKPTYCTSLNGSVTLLDDASTLQQEQDVCGPICNLEGDGNCFCTQGNITTITPICVLDQPGKAFCNKTNPAPYCHSGCEDDQGLIMVNATCECGMGKNATAVCNAGEYCTVVTEGLSQFATCSPVKPELCGSGIDLSSLVGVSVSPSACVCSSDISERDRICAENTYCVVETGNCMMQRIQPCPVCTLMQGDPCYCCDTFSTTHGGIAHIGDVCLSPDRCKVSTPVPRCNRDIVSDCLCGLASAHCTGATQCILDMLQADPRTVTCATTGTQQCQLATYGHCATTLPTNATTTSTTTTSTTTAITILPATLPFVLP